MKENLQNSEIFIKWCQVEVLMFSGYLATAWLYMAIVFCKEPIFEIYNTATAANPKADYLEGALIHVSTISTFVAPCFTSACLLTISGH